jgi:hypothetical protein
MKTFKHFCFFFFALLASSCEIPVPSETSTALLNNYEKKWKCKSIDFTHHSIGQKKYAQYRFNDCGVSRDSIMWFLRELSDLERPAKKYDGIEFVIVNKGFADTTRQNF